MIKNAYRLVSYLLLSFMAITIIGCGEDEEPSLLIDARRPHLFKSPTISCKLTERFAETSIGPDGTLSCFVIDSICNPGEAAKKADDYFDEIANLYRKNAKTELFAEQGVLIYATLDNSLIQIRVGDELNTYMTMRGVTAGAKYMQLQKEGIDKGVDDVCPVMMKEVWNEIEHLHNLGFWEKLKLKISITWIGDALYSIGKPSESVMGKIPTLAAAVIGRIMGKTNSLLITICIISLFVWLLNSLCDKYLDKTPEADKDTMLIGHVKMGKLVFWVKLLINMIIITPALGTFSYFSNMRTEDILYLEAHNMPFVKVIDWGSLTSSSDNFAYYIFILGIFFFLNYIMTPRRLLAYYFHSEGKKDLMLLNRNHTLRDQCVDITRKGKWEFRLFLGTLALVVVWELLRMLVLAVLGIIAWLSSQFPGDDDSSSDSVDVSSSESSSSGMGGGGGIPSAGGGGGVARSMLRSTQSGSHNHQLQSNTNTNLFSHGSGRSGSGYQYDNSEHLNYGDEDNIGKSLAGMGLSQSIAAKLPPEFFKKPFTCTMKRVVIEGIILSCVLIISAPLLLNVALAMFFAIYLGVRFPVSLAMEVIYDRHLDNHPDIYKRYSSSDRQTIKSYIPSITNGDFWGASALYGMGVLLGYVLTFASSAIIVSCLSLFGGQKQSVAPEKIEVFMNPDSTYDYKDDERVITFGHYNEAYSFKRTQLGKVLHADLGYGYVDSLGNEVIPCQYPYATEFFNERALVKIKEGYPLYGIDRDGNTIFKTKYQYGECFSGGKAFVTNDPDKDVGGFIDTEGNIAIAPIYGLWKEENGDVSFPLFSGSQAKVSKKGQNGFVNSFGVFTIADEASN